MLATTAREDQFQHTASLFTTEWSVQLLSIARDSVVVSNFLQRTVACGYDLRSSEVAKVGRLLWMDYYY